MAMPTRLADRLTRGLRFLPAFAAVGLAAAGPPALHRVTGADHATAIAPMQAPALSVCTDAPGENAPGRQFQGADQSLRATYRCNGIPLTLEVARYYSQQPGKEAVSDINRVVDPELLSSPIPTYRSLPSGLRVRVDEIDRGAHPAVVWSWYAVGDSAAARPIDAKLEELLRAISLRPYEVSILRITAWSNDAADAEEVLGTAAAEVWRWYRRREAS